jgi:apolipoprotein N-acyltransferase
MEILKRNKLILLSFLGGISYALGFPIFNGYSLFLFPIIGFSLFCYALSQTDQVKMKLIYGLSYSVGFYAMGFYWIPHLLKEFGGLFFPFNFILGLVFALIIIPQVYVFSFIHGKLKNSIGLAFVYVLLEQFIPQQFPAHIGHSFMSLAPKIHLVFAPLFGAAFYSFLTALLGLSIVEHFCTKKAPRLNYSFLIIACLCHISFFTNSQNKVDQTLSLRIVQPNIGNFLKLESERGGVNSLKQVYESYYFLSTHNIESKRDLIIWPETAYPQLFMSQFLKNKPEVRIPLLLSDIITQTNAELFIGGYDSSMRNNSEQFQTDYNSAFHFSADGVLKNVYHKMKLIPFGEGLPFGPLNQLLSKYLTNISFFAEGESYTTFQTANGVPFVSVICYEVLFTRFVADMLNNQSTEPRFLINLTNDSWYGETAEPHQHLFLTKWRSLEFNIPIVRSTNTGITTILYPDGSESKRLNVGEKTYLDVDLKLSPRTSTFFQKFGLWGLVLVSLLLLGLDLLFKRKTFFK